MKINLKFYLISWLLLSNLKYIYIRDRLWPFHQQYWYSHLPRCTLISTRAPSRSHVVGSIHETASHAHAFMRRQWLHDHRGQWVILKKQPTFVSWELSWVPKTMRSFTSKHFQHQFINLPKLCTKRHVLACTEG